MKKQRYFHASPPIRRMLAVALTVILCTIPGTFAMAEELPLQPEHAQTEQPPVQAEASSDTEADPNASSSVQTAVLDASIFAEAILGEAGNVRLRAVLPADADVAVKGFYLQETGGRVYAFVVKKELQEGAYELAGRLKADADYRFRAAYVDRAGVKHMGGILPLHTRADVPLDQLPPTGDSDERYQFLLGTDTVFYTAGNPPPGYANSTQAAQHMVSVKLPVWKLDTATGRKTSSSITIRVNRKLAYCVRCIFEEIYETGFPIKKLNGYAYRRVGGPWLSGNPLLSMHAFGAAIDINPVENDYYLGKGNDLRDKSNPFCIPDEVIDIFAKYGWYWGGNFDVGADTMHFQYLGLEFLQYHKQPYRVLSLQNPMMRGMDVKNAQERLKELGFLVGTADGIFGAKAKAAVTAFQKKYDLPVSGEIDEATWIKLINLTAYMSY